MAHDKYQYHWGSMKYILKGNGLVTVMPPTLQHGKWAGIDYDHKNLPSIRTKVFFGTIAKPFVFIIIVRPSLKGDRIEFAFKCWKDFE